MISKRTQENMAKIVDVFCCFSTHHPPQDRTPPAWSLIWAKLWVQREALCAPSICSRAHIKTQNTISAQGLRFPQNGVQPVTRMHACACACACVRACVRACVSACVSACVHACVLACACVCVCVCVCVSVCLSVCVCAAEWCVVVEIMDFVAPRRLYESRWQV
jgi:hypothetical protein